MLSGCSEQRSGHLRMAETGPDAESSQLVTCETSDKLALALGAVELHAGRQQHLTARQPLRRVKQLGDVDPADWLLEARLTRKDRKLEPLDEVPDDEHRSAPRQPHPLRGLGQQRAQNR